MKGQTAKGAKVHLSAPVFSGLVVLLDTATRRLTHARDIRRVTWMIQNIGNKPGYSQECNIYILVTWTLMSAMKYNFRELFTLSKHMTLDKSLEMFLLVQKQYYFTHYLRVVQGLSQ